MNTTENTTKTSLDNDHSILTEDDLKAISGGPLVNYESQSGHDYFFKKPS